MRYVTSIERMAMERGEREGREKGLKEGHEEGHKEGHKEGEQQGRVSALRETVIKLLRHRFHLAEDTLTEDKLMPLVRQLQSIQNEPILAKLIDLTLDVETFDDFMAKLHLLLPPPTPVDSAVTSQESTSTM